MSVTRSRPWTCTSGPVSGSGRFGAFNIIKSMVRWICLGPGSGLSRRALDHSAHVVFAEIEDLLAAPSPASP